MPSESQLVSELSKALRHQQAYVLRTTGSDPGAADLVICHQGRWAAVEAKAERGKLSPLQEATARLVTSAGGRWVLVRFRGTGRELTATVDAWPIGLRASHLIRRDGGRWSNAAAILVGVSLDNEPPGDERRSRDA